MFSARRLLRLPAIIRTQPPTRMRSTRSELMFPSANAYTWSDFRLGARSEAGARSLVNGPRLAVHIIHEQVLTEIIRRGEVRLAATQLSHLLDEVHQTE